MFFDDAMKIKAALTAVVTGLSAIWGFFGWLVLLWISLMVLDYLTGSMAAAKQGLWKSRAARAGIWNKAGSISVVLVSAATDLLLHTISQHLPTLPLRYTVLLCPIVVIWYSITELGSIMENALSLGAKVPKVLTQVLSVMQHTADSAVSSAGACSEQAPVDASHPNAAQAPATEDSPSPREDDLS